MSNTFDGIPTPPWPMPDATTPVPVPPWLQAGPAAPPPINTHFETRPTPPWLQQAASPPVIRTTFKTSERPEVDDETRRWYGTATVRNAVQGWRDLYGSDEPTQKWACDNFKWLDAGELVRRFMDHIPSKAERYRTAFSVGRWKMPNCEICSREGREAVIRFFRAEPGMPALLAALELLETDRWTFAHIPARTYIRHLIDETRDGDRWACGNLERWLFAANSKRKLSRQYGAVARRKAERDRDGFCRY